MGGGSARHVVQVYGHAEGARAADANLRIAVDAMAWLRSLGDVPAIILGDTNVSLDANGVESVMAMAG
eukprot:11210304-Lingulodinium_polyedra.AAC.1